MRRPPSSRRNSRSGAIAAQVTLCMTVVLGVAAFVLDGGLMLGEREHAQATADAAALAAAVDLGINIASLSGTNPDGGTSAKTNAVQVAEVNYGNTSNNGTTTTPSYSYTYTVNGTAATRSTSANNTTFTTGSGASAAVTVNIPPRSGSFQDPGINPGYAEVVVTYNQPRYFSGIFGSGSIPISARAVARGGLGINNVPTNIVVLDPSGSGALSVAGNNTRLTVPGAIVVDSTSTSALTASASGVQVVSQTQIDVVGGISGTNVYAPASGSTANVYTGTSAVADPLRNLPVPDTGSLTLQSSSTLNISSTPLNPLQPGIYKGGIAISGSSAVTMASGIYYLEGGGLSITGNNASLTSLTGGVMIYNGQTNGTTGSGTSSTVGVISIRTTVNLSPMTTGPYANISIFQDRNATATVTIAGNSSTTISGVVYAAGATAAVSGGSPFTPGAAFIAKDLSVSGGAAFVLPTSPVTVPLPDPRSHDVRLVE